jgi:hypothetical protein
MNAYRVKHGRLVQAIQAGIETRGFHIISNPEDLPDCRGSKSQKLEHIHNFAEENDWQVKIHNGNGWILFTTAERSLPNDIENDLGQLCELIDGSGWPRLANPMLFAAG